jgi:hypothetical protein
MVASVGEAPVKSGFRLCVGIVRLRSEEDPLVLHDLFFVHYFILAPVLHDEEGSSFFRLHGHNLV